MAGAWREMHWNIVCTHTEPACGPMEAFNERWAGLHTWDGLIRFSITFREPTTVTQCIPNSYSTRQTGYPHKGVWAPMDTDPSNQVRKKLISGRCRISGLASHISTKTFNSVTLRGSMLLGHVRHAARCAAGGRNHKDKRMMLTT